MDALNVSKERVEDFKRVAKDVGNIAMASAMKQISNDGTMKLSIGAGLIHGLARGSLKKGIKAGLVVMGVFVGANVVKNVAANWDVIVKDKV